MVNLTIVSKNLNKKNSILNLQKSNIEILQEIEIRIKCRLKEQCVS